MEKNSYNQVEHSSEKQNMKKSTPNLGVNLYKDTVIEVERPGVGKDIYSKYIWQKTSENKQLEKKTCKSLYKRYSNG